MTSKILAVVGVGLLMGAVACSAAPVETTGSSESAVVMDLHDHCTGAVIGHRLASGDIVLVDGVRVSKDSIQRTDLAASVPACGAPSPAGNLGALRPEARPTCYCWDDSEVSAYGCALNYSGCSCSDGSVWASFSSSC